MSNTITASPGRVEDAPGARGKAAALVAACASLVLVSLVVVSVSRAAFTGTTTNPDNSWASGEVALSDSEAGVAMFSATLMVPGDKVSNSITVTNDSSAASVNVRLYGANLSTTNDLADYLNVTVMVGVDTLFSGTLAAFAATHSNFGNGLDTWNSVAPEATRIYSFEVELDASAGDAQQAALAEIDFVWEAQSNATQGQ